MEEKTETGMIWGIDISRVHLHLISRESRNGKENANHHILGHSIGTT